MVQISTDKYLNKNFLSKLNTDKLLCHADQHNLEIVQTINLRFILQQNVLR